MAAVNIIQYIWRNIYVVGGVPKNQNLPFHLDEVLEVVTDFTVKSEVLRAYTWPFDSVHVHLLLPTRFLFK